MTQTIILQQQLSELWTVNDICARYGVTKMTVFLWRRDRGLPAVVIEGEKRPSIRFVPDDVKAWARANNVKSFRVEAGEVAA